MDKKQLQQHAALVRERTTINSRLNRLYKKRGMVPEVAGKVTKSSDEWPYIEEHVSVQMDEPKEMDAINRQIRILEERLDLVEHQAAVIEQFISAIPDSVTRQIFEFAYIDGKRQREVAETMHMDRSNVSKKVDAYLKLSHNSQK